jgi:5'-nucleotidase
VVVDLVQRLKRNIHSAPWLLNVNVPDIPHEKLLGMQVTRLGKRHQAEPAVKCHSPGGETMFWVGAAGQAQDAGPGTDFFAVANNFAAVTPLQVDLTQYSQLDAVRDWMAAGKGTP